MNSVKYKNDLQNRCYRFSLDVITLTNALPNKRSAWVITDQLIRSATSIGANIVEARASASRLEFKKFYEVSLKSANESKYWLNLTKDSGLAAVETVDLLLCELNQLANILGRSVITLKSKLR